MEIISFTHETSVQEDFLIHSTSVAAIKLNPSRDPMLENFCDSVSPRHDISPRWVSRNEK